MGQRGQKAPAGGRGMAGMGEKGLENKKGVVGQSRGARLAQHTLTLLQGLRGAHAVLIRGAWGSASLGSWQWRVRWGDGTSTPDVSGQAHSSLGSPPPHAPRGHFLPMHTCSRTLVTCSLIVNTGPALSLPSLSTGLQCVGQRGASSYWQEAWAPLLGEEQVCVCEGQPEAQPEV